MWGHRKVHRDVGPGGVKVPTKGMSRHFGGGGFQPKERQDTSMTRVHERISETQRKRWKRIELRVRQI